MALQAGEGPVDWPVRLAGWGDRPGEARGGEGEGGEEKKEGGASWSKALEAGRSWAPVDNKEMLEQKMGVREALCHPSSLHPFRLGAFKNDLVSKGPSILSWGGLELHGAVGRRGEAGAGPHLTQMERHPRARLSQGSHRVRQAASG